METLLHSCLLTLSDLQAAASINKERWFFVLSYHALVGGEWRISLPKSSRTTPRGSQVRLQLNSNLSYPPHGLLACHCGLEKRLRCGKRELRAVSPAHPGHEPEHHGQHHRLPTRSRTPRQCGQCHSNGASRPRQQSSSPSPSATPSDFGSKAWLASLDPRSRQIARHFKANRQANT